MQEEGRVKFEGEPPYWIESPKNAKASAIDNLVWISFETTPRGETGRLAILAATSEAEAHKAKNS